MSEKLTVMQVFERAVEKNGSAAALRYKQAGQWKSKSWNDLRDEVFRAARAIIHLGGEAGKGAVIIGFNCPQWGIANVAAIHAGLRPTGIYTSNTPEQCRFIAGHCEAQVAFVENREQLAKFKEIRHQLPDLRAIVMMYGDDEDEGVFSWQQFLALADHVDESELHKRIDAQSADDVCEYIYTSGTTGDPKGVMLTHDNITWTTKTVFGMLGYQAGDAVISYLPLSHIAEQVVSLFGPMVNDSTVWFAESMEKLPENLKEVRPTIFLAVPRVWEKIQSKIMEAGAKNTGLKKQIGRWARSVGLGGGYADQRGTSRPLLYPVADKLVFSKVRDQLGLDRCRVQITSAAPISKETLEFFLSLGVPIMEVYGMSECSGPITVSLPHRYKTGLVGRKLEGTEIKVAPDGELCVHGRHVFKGYLKNPEATAEALDEEGWLHTGDVGTIDDEGFVQITDRKKDLLITAGGENIAPQLIEGKLKQIPCVSQAVVVGDRRKHLAALLTLDPASLERVIAESGSSAKTMKEAAKDHKVKEWLMKQVEELNRGLARVQSIKKVAILPADLSIEGGELTPTMKVKRKVVNDKYKDVIEGIYGNSPEP